MKEEVFICFSHFFQVLFADCFFRSCVLLFQTLLQHFWRGLQIDDQVRRRELFPEMVVVPVVGIEFLIVEIQAGKDLIFFEDEIRDDHFLRPAPQIKGLQLLKSANQERELRLKCSSRRTLIKSSEKRVLFGISYALRVQALRKNRGQRTLADSYGSFDCDVPG